MLAAPLIDKKLNSYSDWRNRMGQLIKDYRLLLDKHQINSDFAAETTEELLETLGADRIVMAFVAEFSRGKSELINALLFSGPGMRLLPSSPGRTTMCPTEILWDAAEGSYIRLLPIESRLSGLSIGENRKFPENWVQQPVDYNSPESMLSVLREVTSTLRVSPDEAERLGLYSEELRMLEGVDEDMDVEIPKWRHAVVSLPHPLLKQGLVILDTPGLNALGIEPEFTLQALETAQSIVFVLSADIGVSKSDLELWQSFRQDYGTTSLKGDLAVVLNKIDSVWMSLEGDGSPTAAIEAQVHSAAAILNIGVDSIFPLSAKEAIIGKMQAKPELLESSRYPAFESYLADTVILQRQQLVSTTVFRKFGRLLTGSFGIIQTNNEEVGEKITRHKAGKAASLEKLNRLIREAESQREEFDTKQKQFLAGRKVFIIQSKILGDCLNPDNVNAIVIKRMDELSQSMTTTRRLKQELTLILDEIRENLATAFRVSHDMKKHVVKIYGQFCPAQSDVKAPLLSLNEFETGLKAILDQGDNFLNGYLSIVMSKNSFMAKLNGSLLLQLKNLMGEAYDKAMEYQASALQPLIVLALEEKTRHDNRIGALMSIYEKETGVDAELTELLNQESDIRKQLQELDSIRDKLTHECRNFA